MIRVISLNNLPLLNFGVAAKCSNIANFAINFIYKKVYIDLL